MRQFLVKIKVLIEGEKWVRSMFIPMASPVRTIFALRTYRNMGFWCSNHDLQGVHGVRQRVGKGRGATVRDPRSPGKTSSGQRRSSHPTKTGWWAAGLDPILRNFGIWAFMSLIGFIFLNLAIISLIFPWFCFRFP